MASISKDERSSKTAKYLNGEDRISSLPDSVLVHILSFLPTKYAVGTSILSSRWNHLWAYVANLDFNAKFLLDPRRVHSNSSSFMSFVDRVLLLHKLPCIGKLSLTCDGKIDMYRFNTWINVAISRSVQELDIQVDRTNCLKLPAKLFTCETLVVLKLFSFVEFYMPTSVRLPSLKILHISHNYLQNEVTQKLFCNCPVLEDLFIEAVVKSNTIERNYIICGPLLKCLKINLEAFGYYDHLEKVSVNAPSLEYLSIQDNLLACYLLKSGSSLVKADVNIGECFAENYATDEFITRVFVLLREISNVKYLTLGARTMEALYVADGNEDLPLFGNLTHLEVRVYDWNILLHILNSMPNLVNLVLKKCHHLCSNRGSDWIEPQVVPGCLLLHLKEITVSRIKGKKKDLGMIKYILGNAEVLVKMTIVTSKIAYQQKMKFFKNLAMFRRGSKTCQIHFSSELC